MRRINAWLVVIVLSCIIGGLVGLGPWAISALRGDSGAVDLTKEEALKLMNLRTQAVLSQADLNEFVGQLYLKYGLTDKTHDLRVDTGKFVPKEIQNEEVPTTQ